MSVSTMYLEWVEPAGASNHFQLIELGTTSSVCRHVEVDSVGGFVDSLTGLFSAEGLTYLGIVT